MKHSLIKMTALAGLLSIPCAIYAIPPVPGVITTLQPDGSAIELELRGDEHFSWGVTPDGETLMRGDDGFWVPAGNEQIRAAASRAPRANAPSTQVDNSFPTKGKCHLLMLLVNFADTQTTFSQKDFDNYMNQENYLGIGSFRDYYLENSYGALDIETTVTPWITVSGRKTDYGTTSSQNLVYEALEIAARTIDLTRFDNDGDGILDGLAVIHQGTGQESSGLATDIWSHSNVVYGRKVGGLEVRRYTIEPEVLRGSISTIGVMCHEFGHNLGAPDFYDTDYASSGGEYPGTGIWDLMGSGAWNGTYGNRPAGINMWQKIQYGWVEPELLDSDRDIAAMPGATFSPVAYRMNTTVPGDYFIIENRQQDGNFDSALPGSGLLIYHANDVMIAENVEPNTINSKYPQTLYTVCASAGCDPSASAASYGDLSSAPFPGASGSHTAFNDNTLPSSRSISGRLSYRGISGISIAADGSASFRFTMEDAPDAPRNLSATAVKGVVTLKWEMPESSDWNRFNIYRNGILIGQTTTPEYVDASPSASRLVYDVDAEYSSGMISPYTTVTLRVPMNKVVSVTPEMTDAGVGLWWTLDTRLSRMDENAGDSYQVVEHNCSEVEFAHRFSADDLIAYNGYKIRRIGFMAYQPSSEAEYTIQVWKGAEGSLTPTLVSQRTVKEFGTGIWNRILLTSSVTISEGYDYWIGVKIKAMNGVGQMVADNGDLVDGYGNMVRIDGGEWQADTKASGNYYLECELASTTDYVMSPVGTFDSFNPDTDLYYPIGFVVTRDGEPIATTSSRYFLDASPLSGTHTYGVASLYKGGSESTPLEVTVATSSLEGVAGEATPEIIHTAGGIAVTGFHGAVSVYDISGRAMFISAAYDGEVIPLGPGLYVVRAGTSATKTFVR